MKPKTFKLFICLLVMIPGVAAAQDSTMIKLGSGLAEANKTLEVLKRIKLSGYIQAQFQYADSSGQSTTAGGNFPAGTDKRFMIRRGRIKFTYASPKNSRDIITSQYVLQFDVTERGMTIKDAYVNLTDPWKGWAGIKAGMFDRPFGFEIGNSSSLRESPERGRMSPVLFPNERDLGASLILTGPKGSSLDWLRLEAGFFNGTGAPSAGSSTPEFDKKKDFIGRLNAKRSAGKNIQYGIGVSYYDGGFRSDNDTILDATDGGFKIISESGNKGKHYTERRYTGADAQLSIKWAAGTSTLRGEYIQGQQPGDSLTTTSTNAVFRNAVHNRNFNGAYIYFVQSIGTSPLQVVAKYDWYDPNTDVEGDDLGRTVNGLRRTRSTDVRYDTWGFGLLCQWDDNVRITAYYDIVKNETSSNLSGFTKDIRDNLFTLRIQTKF